MASEAFVLQALFIWEVGRRLPQYEAKEATDHVLLTRIRGDMFNVFFLLVLTNRLLGAIVTLLTRPRLRK